MAIKEKIELLENQVLTARSHRLVFRAPEIAKAAAAGQFVMLECQNYLKRPYGILDTDPDKGTLELGIDGVGAGSRWHNALEVGERIDCLGPLGTGFDLPDEQQTLIVLGGGSGIYPLVKACREFTGHTVVILGFRNRDFCLLEDRFGAYADELILASDAGDLDFHGTSVAALAERLDRGDLKNVSIIACGPIPMLAACAELAAARDLPLQCSFEARMGCGVGFCTGCTIPIKDSLPQRCCYEGPVFPADIIDWEALNA